MPGNTRLSFPLSWGLFDRELMKSHSSDKVHMGSLCPMCGKQIRHIHRIDFQYTPAVPMLR